ncbi:hypothetical protein [Pseudomonas sp. W4I3]|uniref:hypothetical protein n=1 Tax=Pseudomonas sp. W4I3 TaxID=3042294 RepID=UPI0027837B8D|nr:hypothetical protein [Pseudomonas sp. W4I3]MDQ0739400.1 hypothetical protein [Pseudomonas sp. W4I3]
MNIQGSPLAQSYGSLRDVGVVVSDAPMKKAPHPMQATLDGLGIDVNLNDRSAQNSQGVRTVFAQKTPTGYDLNTGLFINDPAQGDRYGEFRFYSGLGAKKYQSPECNVLSFDKPSLDRLKSTYHGVEGVTKFLHEFLNLAPCKDSEGYQLSPKRFEYFSPKDSASNGFLIFPNLPYIDMKEYSESAESLKNKKGGVTLGAWAIHPNQPMPLIEQMTGGAAARREFKGDDKSNSRNLDEIEKGTGVKYLSSILDLDKSDLPMLEKLKADSYRHLSETYDVKAGEDKIKMFFHFPVAEKTATLHLHVWANKADHPLNNARSFELDEIIKTLSSGGTVENMVLNRNGGKFYVPTSDTIGSIDGIPNGGVRSNPHVMMYSSSPDLTNLRCMTLQANG